MNVMDIRIAQHADEGAPATAKLSPIERAYRRCAIAFLTVFFGGIGLIYSFLLVVDPWDTGRFPTPLPSGVADIERRTATASRGRDPRFNGAIVGNSRTFMLDPARLAKATGLSFVSLGTPGSGPREEMVVTRYFCITTPMPRRSCSASTNDGATTIRPCR